MYRLVRDTVHEVGHCHRAQRGRVIEQLDYRALSVRVPAVPGEIAELRMKQPGGLIAPHWIAGRKSDLDEFLYRAVARGDPDCVCA